MGSHFAFLLDQERRHCLVPAVSLRPPWKEKLVVSLEVVHSIIPLWSCYRFPSGAMGEVNHATRTHAHGSGITLVAVYRMGDFNPAGPGESKPLKKKRIKPRQCLCFKNQNNNNKKTSQVNYTRAERNL